MNKSPTLIIPIKAMPAPRMTYYSKHTHGDYFEFKKEIYLAVDKECKENDYHFPIPYLIIVFVAPPPSWSEAKKQQAYFTPKLSTPDRDNYDKAIIDALFPKEDGGDSFVYDGRIAKYYAPNNAIVIQPLPDLEFSQGLITAIANLS